MSVSAPVTRYHNSQAFRKEGHVINNKKVDTTKFRCRALPHIPQQKKCAWQRWANDSASFKSTKIDIKCAISIQKQSLALPPLPSGTIGKILKELQSIDDDVSVVVHFAVHMHLCMSVYEQCSPFVKATACLALNFL